MRPAPKPTKRERTQARQAKHDELTAYRAVQSALAIERDNNQCVFCWFQNGKRTPRAEIHHVFSRGDQAGDEREHYTSLLCTCKACHPPPIITGGSPELDYILAVRKQANEMPINKKFIGRK